MKNKTIPMVLVVLLSAFAAFAQTTEFTYQGNLRDGANPASGNYDFEFALYDTQVGGTLLTTPLTRNAVIVSNGSFAVKLDFGNQFPGANRFLEIRVRLTGQPGITTLAPRQQLNSNPYAVKSMSADTALSSTNATNALQLGGVAANQYVLTGDARLSDARTPTAGSTSYIQNQIAGPQALTNFHISGEGWANMLSAATQFNIGGNRVLSIGGTGNLFVGPGTGWNNVASDNSVFGSNAGFSNASGTRNAFFGRFTGNNNVTGSDNSYFGYSAGNQNVAGERNAFFGRSAGAGNTASDNSFFGTQAGQANSSGTHNSFFGLQAGFNNTTGNDNSFFGYLAGFSNAVGGTNNSFVGARAGFSNTSGVWNSFFGASAGTENTTGQLNSFFGKNAGERNTTASSNSFFGAIAGSKTTIGCCNSFFGSGSGTENNGGESNAFFGSSSGANNTSGGQNSLFGSNAGFSNTIGINNSFFGFRAGWSNTTGDLNTFFGASAGDTNTTENGNTLIGAGSNAQAGVFSATAIGSFSFVTRDNSLVLGGVQGMNGGTDTNVGIGTTAPNNRLQVVASLNAVATPTGHVALIENTNTGTSPDVLALKIGRATNPDDSNNFITFFKGDNTSAGSIQGNAAGGVMLGGPGSDYAEWLPRLDPNEKIEPGDIVGLSNGRISRSTAGASQVMAVSTGAIVAGNDPGEDRRELHSLIAFIGQAMVKVIGSVSAGDFIIASGLDNGTGIAVSPKEITAAQFGQAIGQAWESSDDNGLKRIRVSIGLTRSDPTVMRLFEQTRKQEERILSLELQITELRKLLCQGNTQATVCKEQ